MIHKPPVNSKIEIESFNGQPLIIIPHGNAGIMRYFTGALLLFWLGGWSLGFISAIREIIFGGGGVFLIFWLGGWSLGGIFAIYYIYRIFRKSIPERVLIGKGSFLLDTGMPPLKITFGYAGRQEYWKSIFFKRKKYKFNQKELRSIKLRETDMRNRLTIDKNAERIDIATSASEIERVWLFEYLKNRYSL